MIRTQREKIDKHTEQYEYIPQTQIDREFNNTTNTRPLNVEQYY